MATKTLHLCLQSKSQFSEKKDIVLHFNNSLWYLL